MNFNSGVFLIYLPIVVAVYRLLPHKYGRIWLLAASYFFYMYWNPLLIILLLVSTATDYFCGLGMARFEGNKQARKALLLCSVFINLGILFFFKYWDFFAENTSALLATLSIPYKIHRFNLILPVGISFYTFQTMSYTIDVYRGDFKAEKDPITFALYVTFFPQLVAGPIESPANLLPQLREKQPVSEEDIRMGLRFLISGFFRKCAVADVLGIYVSKVFNNPTEADSLSIIIASTLFCFQMYCDFAGYSEIARGSARLIGVKLMKNFDTPYLAKSYGEFFRRWHISLNRWFTQYVYIPLGGSRKGKARAILNTFIVFGLCGFWHGARWTYILWGLYAALWISVERLFQKPFLAKIKATGIDFEQPLINIPRRIIMFALFIPAALFFRSANMTDLSVLFTRMFTTGISLNASLTTLGLNGFTIIQITLTLIALAKLPAFTDEEAISKTGISYKNAVTAAFLVIATALCWIALLATEAAAEFAYFQF